MTTSAAREHSRKVDPGSVCPAPRRALSWEHSGDQAGEKQPVLGPLWSLRDTDRGCLHTAAFCLGERNTLLCEANQVSKTSHPLQQNTVGTAKPSPRPSHTSENTAETSSSPAQSSIQITTEASKGPIPLRSMGHRCLPRRPEPRGWGAASLSLSHGAGTARLSDLPKRRLVECASTSGPLTGNDTGTPGAGDTRREGPRAMTPTRIDRQPVESTWPRGRTQRPLPYLPKASPLAPSPHPRPPSSPA